MARIEKNVFTGWQKKLLNDPLANIILTAIVGAIFDQLFNNIYIGIGVALALLSIRAGIHFYNKPRIIVDGQFLGISPGPKGTFIQNYQCEIRSRTNIRNISGYVISNVTGEKYPILLRGSDGIYPPEDANEILKGAEFGISAFFVPFKEPMNQYDGLDTNTFLAILSDFTLVLEINNELYKYRYPPQKVKQKIDQLLGYDFKGKKPRVTRQQKG